MPYVQNHIRLLYTDIMASLSQRGITSAGALNYLVSVIVDQFIADEAGVQPNYDAFNAAIGALECAKLELYRRRVAPYEDEKIELNGDIR